MRVVGHVKYNNKTSLGGKFTDFRKFIRDCQLLQWNSTFVLFTVNLRQLWIYYITNNFKLEYITLSLTKNDNIEIVSIACSTGKYLPFSIS